MVSFYQEIINPTMGSSEKGNKSAQEQSPLSNINKNVDISKMGENDMPFQVDLQVGIFA
jgi:hypothetical protein